MYCLSSLRGRSRDISLESFIPAKLASVWLELMGLNRDMGEVPGQMAIDNVFGEAPGQGDGISSRIQSRHF